MPDLPLAQRVLGAYLGFAIGDALGATVEFLNPREIAAQYGVHRNIVGGGWLHLKAGQVTDDTTMSLALGRTILEHGGEIDALAAAQAFDAWMRGKPIDIGNTVRRNLIHFRRTGNTEAPPSEQDAGNGAAMRVLPVVLATLGRSEDELAAALLRQAHITHNNAASDAASFAFSALARDLLQGTPLAEARARRIPPLLEAWPLFDFTSGRRIESPSGYVVHTAIAVFQALFSTDSFESCLIDIVNRGGDADTTGAIVGMLAGACYGLEAIPQRWLRALLPDVARACREQALALLALQNLPPTEAAADT